MKFSIGDRIKRGNRTGTVTNSEHRPKHWHECKYLYEVAWDDLDPHDDCSCVYCDQKGIDNRFWVHEVEIEKLH